MLKYSMQLFWSEEDDEYVALVPEFPHVTALARTPEQALREVVTATKAVVEGMAERGMEPPEPQMLSSYSGQLRVRMPRTLHQRLAGRARMEDVSLNTLIVSILGEGMGMRVALEDSMGEPRVAAGASGGKRSDLLPATGSRRRAAGGET